MDGENIEVVNGMAELDEVVIVIVLSVAVDVNIEVGSTSNVLLKTVDVFVDISTDVSRVEEIEISMLGEVVVGVSMMVKGDDETASDLVRGVALGVEVVCLVILVTMLLGIVVKFRAMLWENI